MANDAHEYFHACFFMYLPSKNNAIFFINSSFNFVPVPPSKGSTLTCSTGYICLAYVVTRLRPPTPHNFIALMDCGRFYPSATNL